MDIAVVTPRYPPLSTGGGEKSAELLAKTLKDSDRVDNVTVFAFDGAGHEMRDGVEVRRLGSVSAFITEYQNLVSMLKLRGHLIEFDIVHGYNMELHPAVGHLSSKLDIPSVATLNSYHFFPKSVTNTTPNYLERIYERIGYPTTGRLLRYYLKQIDVFIALSEAIQQIYQANGFKNARFKQIPNMIDRNFSVPPLDQQSDGYDLLYVGTLSENKGVKYLIEAVNKLPSTYHLNIVGKGDCEENLKRLVNEYDLTDRIEFSGWVSYDEIGQVYANADVFVHPGIWPEPLNRTILEAMQAGLPVVCTDIGGPPEVIPTKEMLCEPENPTALADTIRRIETTDTDIGKINREYVTENHSPDVVVPQIIDLYEDVISDRN